MKPARALLIAFVLAAGPAHAARPLTVEDAGVIDEKRCQVEAWVDRFPHAWEAWIAPACNFGGGIEWQVGGARTHAAGETRFTQGYTQAKWLWPGSRDDLAWASVLGVARAAADPSHRTWDSPYTALIGSVLLGEAWLHGTVGMSHDHRTDRRVTTWGIAGELPWGDATTLLGEVFGENRARRYARVGVRREAVKEVLSFDISCLARIGGTRDERMVSLGVFWQSARILP